jgi:hypothetical protein
MLNIECLAGIHANEPETWNKKNLKQKTVISDSRFAICEDVEPETIG